MGPEPGSNGETRNGVDWRIFIVPSILSGFLWIGIVWLIMWLTGCTQLPQRQGLVQPICLMACQNNASPLDLGDHTENPAPPEYYRVKK